MVTLSGKGGAGKMACGGYKEYVDELITKPQIYRACAGKNGAVLWGGAFEGGWKAARA